MLSFLKISGSTAASSFFDLCDFCYRYLFNIFIEKWEYLEKNEGVLIQIKYKSMISFTIICLTFSRLFFFPEHIYTQFIKNNAAYFFLVLFIVKNAWNSKYNSKYTRITTQRQCVKFAKVKKKHPRPMFEIYNVLAIKNYRVTIYLLKNQFRIC